MAKKYVHLRLEEFAYKELKKIKNILELEKNDNVDFSATILSLIHERITSKPFKLDRVFSEQKDKV